MFKRSILFRLTLSFAILFFLLIGYVAFLMYEIKHVRGFNTSVDISGSWSRANHIAIAKNVGLYYEEVCVSKKDGKYLIDRIDMHKKKYYEGLLALEKGEQGAKSVKAVGEKAEQMLSNLKNKYENLFSLVDKFLSTCDPSYVPKIDALSAEMKDLGDELTSMLAKEGDSALRNILVTFSLGVLFIILVMIATYLSLRKAISNNIDRLSDHLNNFGKLNFTKKLEAKDTIDEFKKIIHSANIVERSISQLMNSIKVSSTSIYEGVKREEENLKEIEPVSKNIKNLVENVFEIGNTITNLLSEVLQGTEEMKVAISEISKNTMETANRAKALMSSSEEQFKETQQLVFSMDKIREISDTIKGIAEQTNLLALNASIEAARAGEAGKGFAVVANEVKELARKVSEFIGEIERTIDELSDRVNAVAKKAKESKEQAIEVENSTSVIANAVEEQTAVINSIIEHVMETREKSFNFISDVEALNKDSLTLESITKDLRISTELLSEIGETLTKVEEVIEIDVKAPSDEELSQMSVISLIKLGILGHINWKVNFIKDVLIGKMPQVERDHRRCLLGRSMQYLEKKLSGTPIFKTLSELEEPHAKLHGLVERLEREVKIDNKEEALKFIEEEVIPIFKKVIGGLKEILKECIRLGCN